MKLRIYICKVSVFIGLLLFQNTFKSWKTKTKFVIQSCNKLPEGQYEKFWLGVFSIDHVSFVPLESLTIPEHGVSLDIGKETIWPKFDSFKKAKNESQNIPTLTYLHLRTLYLTLGFRKGQKLVIKPEPLPLHVAKLYSLH